MNCNECGYLARSEQDLAKHKRQNHTSNDSGYSTVADIVEAGIEIASALSSSDSFDSGSSSFDSPSSGFDGFGGGDSGGGGAGGDF